MKCLQTKMVMQQVEKRVEMTDPSETQEQEVQGQGNILSEKKEKLSGTNMWLQAIKLLYKLEAKFIATDKKQKWLCLRHNYACRKMARGEEAYQGKLLEARQIGLERRGRVL